MAGFAATISSSSSLAPCCDRASTYALDIATVSLNIPPRAAVTTIRPALGGPSSTTFHSSGEKAAFVVISRSRPRRHGDPRSLPAAPGRVEEHGGTILTNAAGRGRPGTAPSCAATLGLAGTRHTGQLGLPPPKEGSA